MINKIRRKKRGVALVFTMMVAVLAVAIATSYIGMTASSAKAARSYSKEALALSLAQTGLNATINAMGVPSNWSNLGFVNIFSKLQNGTGLYIATNANNGLKTDVNNTTKVAVTKDDNLYSWFESGFLIADNAISNAASFYRTNVITLHDVQNGKESTKYAYLIIGVTPENLTNIQGPFANISRTNINYSVGVAALIFDTEQTDIKRDSCIDKLVASRVVKYRVSSVFPGSMYQNMAAADYPGTGHQDEGHFGYPNWDDCTADAAFMDENTQWDGSMSVDGRASNGYGASSNNSTVGNNNTKNFSARDAQAYMNGYTNSDSSGFLKISLLNKGDIKNKTKDQLPKISKTAVANQKIVYYDMTQAVTYNDNSRGAAGYKKNLATSEYSGVIGKICTSSSKPYTDDSSSTNMDTIWNRQTDGGTRSLLSAIDSSGNQVQGEFRMMKAQTAGVGVNVNNRTVTNSVQ